MVKGSKRSFIWKIPKDEFLAVVKESISINALVYKYYGHAGNRRTIMARIKEQDIDISHFLGKQWAKGKRRPERPKYTMEEILIEDSTYSCNGMLKKRLYRNKMLKEECSKCGIGPEYNGEPLVLQLDHINGCHTDNRINNLRILCPNCHSQTPTFCSKTGSRYTKPKHLRQLNKCTDCDKNISNKAVRCTPCNNALRKKVKKEKKAAKVCVDCKKNISKKATRCLSCSAKKFNPRKVKNRPSIETLKKETAELGFKAVGRKYGVSDNAIRKWMK